ncbi:MAG: NADH-quinone oxidoreductase subunit C [Armatimonadota bacterium]|nr:NADH-quinone oxidoreductase subunit C [Armatimonadota bacterium]
MSEFIEASIRKQFPDAVIESSVVDGVLTLKIDAAKLLSLCEYLKSASDLAFDYPADIAAVDWTDRLEMVYHLYSISRDHKLILKVDLPNDKPAIASVTSVWKGADWPEREIFDLFGIKFEGHPDLRRILLPEEFEGYPLRKDYVIPD